jgi:hypothetical protein
MGQGECLAAAGPQLTLPSCQCGGIRGVGETPVVTECNRPAPAAANAGAGGHFLSLPAPSLPPAKETLNLGAHEPGEALTL